MEEKKMTDEEIIKALKFAIAQGEADGIGFWNNNMKWCEFSMKEILDLIKRLQADNATLKSNKFASWKIKFFNLKEEFDKELEEHKEFTKKANAEIERLTSLYDGKSGFMTSSIGDLPLTVEGLRKAVDEISRLLVTQTELQELNAKYYNEAKDLRRKNAELQKQVDELKKYKDFVDACKLGGDIEIVMNRVKPYAILREKAYQQAVKDTGIKCYYKMLEDCPIISDEEHEYSRFVSDYETWLKEEFNIEVE